VFGDADNSEFNQAWDDLDFAEFSCSTPALF
jgi:hypothetical protein